MCGDPDLMESPHIYCSIDYLLNVILMTLAVSHDM